MKRATATAVLAVMIAGGASPLSAAEPSPAASAFGTWQPTSRALEPLGALTLGAESLRWSICRDVKPQALAGAGAPTFALAGAPGCTLDGRHLSHLRIAPRPGGCSAELSLFASPAALQAGEAEAWGVVERDGCR